jgi:D-alanyl-D-alanine carboxypeptidase-like protein/type IV secretion system pilin
MINKKNNIKLFARLTILIIVVFYFLIFANNIFAAELTCDTKYPGDGQCTTEEKCAEGSFFDSTADLCPDKQKCCHKGAVPTNIVLQVPILGYTQATGIAEYIGKIYESALYIIVPITIIVIIAAGVRWVISAGNVSKIKEAKKYISNAFLGLFIALLGYVVLSMIGLTSISQVDVQYIEGLPDYSDYFELIGNEAAPQQDFSKYRGPINMVVANCVTVSGTKKVYISAAIKDALEGACRDATATGYNLKAIAGGIRKGSKHCHGKSLAVDINVPQNYCVDCYGSKGAKVGKFFRPGEDPLSLTQAAVNAFKKNGWCWGGDWGSFKDYMHFSHSCSTTECAQKGPYDWSLTVKQNHAKRGTTWP